MDKAAQLVVCDASRDLACRTFHMACGKTLRTSSSSSASSSVLTQVVCASGWWSDGLDSLEVPRRVA